MKNKINLPGLNAEVSLVNSDRQYSAVKRNLQLNNDIIPSMRIGTGLNTGGRGELGFKCDTESCRCDGMADCIDLAGTGICHHFNCYVGWVTGEWVCTCKR